MGVSTGLGPISAWTGARYPRLNRITVGGTGGTRYLAEQVYDPHAVEMTSVTGLDALKLAPTASDDLVDQINAADKFPKWALLASLSVLLLIVGISNLGSGALASGVVVLIAAVLATGLTIILYRKESIEHLVPVEYTLEGQIPAWTAQMERTWAALRRLSGSWRLIESGRVRTTHQYKINAGAHHVVSRVAAAFSTANPKVLVTNITVPSVKSGNTTLYFLPDRILVRTGRRWTDVGYRYLRVDVRHQQFIENGTPPRDAKQVGTTWKFVNKSGGPDRRFNNNRQLPVMLYGRVTLTSPHGLSWILDLSVTDIADSLVHSLNGHPA
jgi:DNA polymerase-3 subunit epsilon